MGSIGELERQVESLQQRNAELTELVRQRDEQLMIAVREIKSTRKDVSTARDELEHLRDRVKALQEKVTTNERDTTALLQTVAPLLNQLLDSETSAGKSVE